MIKSIEVKNYKALDRIRVEGFSNINVFVGANNCGKTLLLEAVFLNLNAKNPNALIYTYNTVRKLNFIPKTLQYLFNKLNIEPRII